MAQRGLVQGNGLKPQWHTQLKSPLSIPPSPYRVVVLQHKVGSMRDKVPPFWEACGGKWCSG